MSGFGFLKYFIPQDRKFFPLFDKAASNVHEGGKAIYALVTAQTPEERVHYLRLIEKIEHAGDEITHEIFKELGSNFITPFDREDIHRLVTAIDDIIDYIHGSSKRIELYKLTEFDSDIIKLADLIQQTTDELRRAVLELKNMKKMRDITASLVRINSIENHADDIFDHAVAGLFEKETNAVRIIMVKEILQGLETATDKCEDAANVIESIMIKMA
jgi:predicted phosphate transport protein (TIGR00153 family)